QGGLDIGTYYVRGKRNAAPSPATPGVTGSGCLTSVSTFKVLDMRIVPIVAIATTSNTACDGNFDAQIIVNANTPSGPGSGSTYNFLWQSNPGGTVVVNDALGAGSPHVTGGADLIGPGSYVIRVENTTTNCLTNAAITILSIPQPVDILSVSKTDQLICYPDGSISVATLTPPGAGNYLYQWFKTNPAAPALVDNFTTVIDVSTLVPGLAPQQYPAMGFGTYYVKATKNVGTGLGSGCETPPFRVNVLDLHKDPRIQFTFQPNSSCDAVNPNGVVLADASEQSGANGDTYSFAWTLNAGVIPPPTTQTDTNNSSLLGNANEGTYVLQVTNVSNTGCQFSSSLAVAKDLNTSLPNILTYSKTNPMDCLSSGDAQVTAISVGGGPSITGVPLNTNFVYEWYANTFTPGGLVPVITRNINAIGPGSYFVVAQDNATKCKSGPTNIVILDTSIVYPVVQINQTVQQISCSPGVGTAALVGTADGQNDTNVTYTFDWFQNLSSTPPTYANSSTITNLPASDYSLSVRNVTTNCTASALFIVPNDAPSYIPLISIGGQPRSYCVGQNGIFLSRVTNLTPLYPFPYNFTSDLYIGGAPNLANPPDYANMPLVPGFVESFTQPGLAEGTYTVRITDNNTGCIAVKSGPIDDTRINPVVTVLQDNPMTICDPARPNGQLAATADGGKVGGYQFGWFAGNTVPSPISGLLTSDDKLIGRTVGTYVVLVTNTESGCFSSKSGSILDGSAKPPVPNATVVFDRRHCVTPDGWVSASVGGETISYTFNWYKGASVKPLPDFVGINYNQLDIGSYAVTARDIITGCVSAAGTVTVNDGRVTPQFILTSTPSLCLDTGKPATGSLILTLQSQDMAVDDVLWTDLATGSTVGNGPQVLEVYPGTYRAMMTSSFGCTNEGNVLVGTEVDVYNGLSANNDNFNNVFIIECISNFPNNNVKIFNRSGMLVYEGNNYNNIDVAFTGMGESGLYLQGRFLPEGTYFYLIDKGNGTKLVSGYLELTR
ncbi:MAG: gliding motility-associated C-terminal domain-containing protein, partial [Cytophagales bacterium]|nr:gliding motility-associated C-terminal domain-containing protein [Cytophagales bacterium]